jgi:peptidoglycan/LPS O-acetylase OafA/YrhL
MSKGTKGHLYTLDSWRAVAILAVLVDHIVAYTTAVVGGSAILAKLPAG